MLMRNTSAPASNRRAIISALPEAGPSVATILVRRSRLIGATGHRRVWQLRRRLPARRRQHRRAGRQRPLLRRFGGLGELHRPGALLAGVDLEEAGAVEAARQAILRAADGEFLVARAHEGLAGPFAAAVVVDRVDVIEARDQRALEQGLAGARRQVPPAFGGPGRRRPCSRSRCRPGCRCCCTDGSRPPPERAPARMPPRPAGAGPT